MNFTLINVTKQDGDKVEGTYVTSCIDLPHYRGRRPQDFAEDHAQRYEDKHHGKPDIAVVAYINNPHPTTVYKDLVRLDYQRVKNPDRQYLTNLGKSKREPTPFSGTLRCVFTDPPKESGTYPVVDLTRDSESKTPIRMMTYHLKDQYGEARWEQGEYTFFLGTEYWLDFSLANPYPEWMGRI